MIDRPISCRGLRRYDQAIDWSQLVPPWPSKRPVTQRARPDADHGPVPRCAAWARTFERGRRELITAVNPESLPTLVNRATLTSR